MADVKLKFSVDGLKETTQQVKEVEKSFSELRKEYQALKNTSFAGKSVEEIAAIKNQMAGLRADMADFKSLEDSLDKGNAFKNIAGSIGVVSGAMAGLTGAYSLFGAENEQMNALQQKTIALMGVAQAAQGVQDSFDQNVYLNKIKRIVAHRSALMTEALTINTVSTASKTAAFFQTLWNKTIAANPIGAIIVAVAALAAGIYYLTTRQKENTKTQLEAVKSSEEFVKATEDSITNSSKQLENLNSLTEGTTEYKDEVTKLTSEYANYLTSQEEITLQSASMSTAIDILSTAMERQALVMGYAAAAQQIYNENGKLLLENMQAENTIREDYKYLLDGTLEGEILYNETIRKVIDNLKIIDPLYSDNNKKIEENKKLLKDIYVAQKDVNKGMNGVAQATKDEIKSQILNADTKEKIINVTKRVNEELKSESYTQKEYSKLIDQQTAAIERRTEAEKKRVEGAKTNADLAVDAAQKELDLYLALLNQYNKTKELDKKNNIDASQELKDIQEKLQAMGNQVDLETKLKKAIEDRKAIDKETISQVQTKQIENYILLNENVGNNIDLLKEQKTKLETYKKSLEDLLPTLEKNSDEYYKAQISITEVSNKLLDNAKATEESTKVTEEKNKAIAEQIRLQKELTKSYEDQLRTLEASNFFELTGNIDLQLIPENKIKENSDRIKSLKTELVENLTLKEEDKQKILAELIDLQTQQIDIIKDAEARKNQLAKDLVNQTEQSLYDLAMMWSQRKYDDQLELLNNFYDAQNERMAKQYETQSNIYDDQVKNGLISQDRANFLKGELEKKYEDEQDLRDQKREKEQKRLARDKAKYERDLALTRITIDTAVAVAKTIAEYAGYPLLWGPIVALQAGMFAVQAATIASTPLPKAEKGGYITGSRHSNGGVNVNAEDGEFIVNRIAMNNPTNALMVSAINNQSNSSGAMDIMISNIVSKVSAIPVIVSEKDISRVQRKVMTIENRTNLF